MRLKRKLAVMVFLCLAVMSSSSVIYAGQAYSTYTGKTASSVSGNEKPGADGADEDGGGLEPEETTTPGTTSKPEATVTPGATTSPEATITPEGTATPGVPAEPEATATPEVTPVPEIIPDESEMLEDSEREEDEKRGRVGLFAAMPGAGTAENPYIITDAESFKNIGNNLSASYKLAADIDFDGEALTPIGTASMPFTGSFDGADHTIKNFSIIPPNTGNVYIGLFGFVTNGTIKNMNIESAEINLPSQHYYVGLLVGYLYNGTIQNISFTDVSVTNPGGQYTGILLGYVNSTAMIENISLNNSVVSGGNYVGVLGGYITSGWIKNCHVLGTVSVNGTTNVGGLTGYAIGGGVEDCSVSGTGMITGTNSVGGMIGSTRSVDITRCFAAVDVTGENSIGGLVGYINDVSNVIKTVNECYASGDVVGKSNVGGLIGTTIYVNINNSFAIGSVTSTTNNGYTGGLLGQTSTGTRVTNCYAAGAVGSYGSGLVAVYATPTVTSSYFDSDTTGKTTPATQARTTDQMLTKENYLNWDWEKIWNYKEGSYPTLRNITDTNILMPFIITCNELTYTTANLEWPDINGAISYQVSYGGNLINASTSEVLIENLLPDTEYTFRVRAKNDTTTGAWSNSLVVKTKKVAAKVTGLHKIAKTAHSITFEWDEMYDVQSYEFIFNNEIISTTENAYTMTGLQSGVSYVVSVRAIIADGTTIISKASDAIIEKIYTVAPQTTYAQTFINKCEGQTWFIDEMENLLNTKGKSINTITSREDLTAIYAIGLADRGLTGTIPAAIGELTNLKYLYLANNHFEGELPDEINTLSNLIEIDLTGNNISE